MVGPTPDEDRTSLVRQLKLAFVALIGLSSGLITSQGDVTLLQTVAVTALGTVVGAVVVWIVFPGDGLPAGGLRR